MILRCARSGWCFHSLYTVANTTFSGLMSLHEYYIYLDLLSGRDESHIDALKSQATAFATLQIAVQAHKQQQLE